MKTEKESAITKKVMKTEKQIQEEVWKSLEAKYRVDVWDITATKIITEAVAKTIELMKTDYAMMHHDRLYQKIHKEVEEDIQEKLSKTDTVNVKSYDEGYAAGYVEGMGKGVHTDAYIEGYEAAKKELTKK